MEIGSNGCEGCREKILPEDRYCGRCGLPRPADQVSDRQSSALSAKESLTALGLFASRLALLVAALIDGAFGAYSLFVAGEGAGREGSGVSEIKATSALIVALLYVGAFLWSRRSTAAATFSGALLYTTTVLLEPAVFADPGLLGAVTAATLLLLWNGFFCAVLATRGVRAGS
jgi:hypothetical protein